MLFFSFLKAYNITLSFNNFVLTGFHFQEELTPLTFHVITFQLLIELRFMTTEEN